MEKHNQLILVEHFCHHYNVSFSFVDELEEYGLVQVVKENEQKYIEEEQLNYLEKLMRLRYDMDINLEGIDVINHLLDKIQSLQEEVKSLNNKLSSQRVK